MIYEFAATQDLHGYAKPWAPGTGVNLLDAEHPEHLQVKESTYWAFLFETPGTYQIQSFGIIPGESYYIYAQVYDSLNEEWKATQYLIANSTITNRSITIGENDKLYIYDAYASHTEATAITKFTTSNLLVAISDDPVTAYSPYANICPPEGFNIWNPTNQEYVQVYAGYVNANTRELYLRPVYKEYAGEELVGPWMSSLDPYEEDTTPTEGAFVIDFGGELTSFEITPFMLQTLLDSLGIRQHFTDGAGLLNSLMDQAQGRVRSEEELLHLSRPLKVIAIGDQLPAGLTFKPISKDVLPGLPGKFIR